MSNSFLLMQDPRIFPSIFPALSLGFTSLFSKLIDHFEREGQKSCLKKVRLIVIYCPSFLMAHIHSEAMVRFHS